METLSPLMLFAFVSSITPGPNNIMLTSSGIRFGFARTMPHIAGVNVGFGTMLALCGAGIGSLVLAVPAIQTILKIVGSAYLLYLAWQLRRLSLGQEQAAHAKPMTFAGAALFQFVNPKAWIMAVTGASAFLPAAQSPSTAVLLLCAVFCLINFFCISVWTGTGAALRRALAQSKWQRLFCAVMVVLTLYAALSLWL